jgi:hypothetical protein
MPINRHWSFAKRRGFRMRRTKDNWRSLRVGDRVRFVRVPSFQGVVGGGLLPETLRLYKKLIARGTPQRVFQLDEYGLPWIACRFRRKNGKWEHHWLAINDDSWVLVKSRQ